MNIAIVTANLMRGTDPVIKVYPVECAGYDMNTVTAYAEKDTTGDDIVISHFTIINRKKTYGFNQKLYFAATNEQYKNICAGMRTVDAAGIIKSFEGLLPVL